MKRIAFLLLINILFFTGCSKENTSMQEVTETSQIEIVEKVESLYGTDYDSTWGDLIKANDGEPVWDTLTPAQQALVHYPKFDESNVYWVPEGSAYHAVDWCYTLSRSKTILSGTYDEAANNGLRPCSKCVGE